MLFANARRVGSDAAAEIRLDTDSPALNIELKVNNALVYPGLVNWHDHLDFNLFTQLGDRTYDNYTQWGAYIHTHYAYQIGAVLKIPAHLRTSWGIYKNLLCGVTKVVNHGEYLPIYGAPIKVKQGHSIHSVQFEGLWKFKLNNPLKRKLPAMIHVGEGTDQSSQKEIDQLLSWNLINKKLIGIHGVAMTAEQARRFDALVWCPASNYYLLNKTAPVNELKKHTRILFGTDSTLTGHWDIWEHIRLARRTKLLTDAELYDCLTGDDGAFVVVNDKHSLNTVDAFYATTPADVLLVVCDSRICLFDDSLVSSLSHLDMSAYSKISINNVCKYVLGDLPGLMKEIATYCPDVIFPIKAA